MSFLFHTARLVLPLLLFGYGVVANLTVLTGPSTSLALPVSLPRADLLAGGLTRDFEQNYKSVLPHFAPSFGLIGAARYAVLDEARLGAVVGREGWLFSAEEARALPDAHRLEAAVQHIKTVQALLAARGTELVVLAVPAKIEVERARSPDMGLSDAMALLDTRFLTSLRGAGIVVVDPREAMMGQEQNVFFATDTHWTPFGAAQAASAVAAELHHGPLTYTTGRVTAKPLTGDLIQFVTDADFAPMIGLLPEQVMLSPITATSAPTDIFSAAPLDIVLIGTSYSANSDWGFADALTRALGREVENHAMIGLGPVVPMSAYLQAEDFKATPPTTVIWEYPIRYLTDPDLFLTPPRIQPLVGGGSSVVASNE